MAALVNSDLEVIKYVGKALIGGGVEASIIVTCSATASYADRTSLDLKIAQQVQEISLITRTNEEISREELLSGRNIFLSLSHTCMLQFCPTRVM